MNIQTIKKILSAIIKLLIRFRSCAIKAYYIVHRGELCDLDHECSSG
jgi:hypothetical protein